MEGLSAPACEVLVNPSSPFSTFYFYLDPNMIRFLKEVGLCFGYGFFSVACCMLGLWARYGRFLEYIGVGNN